MSLEVFFYIAVVLWVIFTIGEKSRKKSNIQIAKSILEDEFHYKTDSVLLDKWDVFGFSVLLEQAACTSFIMNNYHSLSKDFKTGVHTDAYGIEDDKKWLSVVNKIYDNLLKYDISSAASKALDELNLRKEEKESLIFLVTENKTTIVDVFDSAFRDAHNLQEEESFDEGEDFSISQLELIEDGFEYEHAIGDLINRHANGWRAEVSKGSGDQGLDVMATLEESGLSIAIQTKLYSSPVGNKAVQEVIAAKGYYGTDGAMVVTNNSFTKSANELAEKHDVININHRSLLEALEFISSEQ